MGTDLSLVRRRGTLVAACLGFVVVLLDVSVVNVALESLRIGLDADVADLQWIVNAYTLVFAALLLTAGAFGDRYGAKRLFMVGLSIFTLASLGCGFAANLGLLIAARAVQGLGAALLVPNSLSLLRQAFPNPRERGRAIGWWGAAGGIALAAGPVLGGLLVTQMGWRSIFLINLPIGLLGIGLTLRYAQPSVIRIGKALDLAGQVLGVLTLVGLTAALTEAGRLGWQSTWMWGGVAFAFVAGAAFLRLESRRLDPMLPLGMFRNTSFSVALAAGAIVNFAYYGLLFMFSLFFQSIQHLSSQQTGLAFLPMTGILMVMNIVAGRMVGPMGPRRLMVAGLSMAAAGYVLLLPIAVDRTYLALVLPMLLIASGTALTIPTMTSITLSAVDVANAGIASGVLNTARQIGGVLGVAVCGLGVGNPQPTLFMQGMHLCIALAAAFLAFGAMLSFWGVESGASAAGTGGCRAGGSEPSPEGCQRAA